MFAGTQLVVVAALLFWTSIDVQGESMLSLVVVSEQCEFLTEMNQIVLCHLLHRIVEQSLSQLNRLLFRLGEPVDIVDTLVADGRFKTLVQAVELTDFARGLKAPGPFTVFAPTDEAFDKLGPDFLEALFDPKRRGLLLEVILYHVVTENLTAAAIIAMNPPVELETMRGPTVLVTLIDRTQLEVNKVKVIETDISATNGIIHVVDEVVFIVENNRIGKDAAGWFRKTAVH